MPSGVVTVYYRSVLTDPIVIEVVHVDPFELLEFASQRLFPDRNFNASNIRFEANLAALKQKG